MRRINSLMRLPCPAFLAAACACAAGIGPARGEPGAHGGASSLLHEDTFDAWRDHLALQPDEILWRSIPWLSTFSEGLAQSAAQHKPLLLWVMNGHPLGCT